MSMFRLWSVWGNHRLNAVGVFRSALECAVECEVKTQIGLRLVVLTQLAPGKMCPTSLVAANEHFLKLVALSYTPLSSPGRS